MKHLIFTIILLTAFNAFAKKEYQRIYFENGNIQSEGWIENGKKVKFWRFYYENGNIKKEGHFSEDKQTKYWKYKKIKKR